MKVQCDVCAAEAASVFCCADEAALCDACDRRVHRANKLAGKHRRFSLLNPAPPFSSSGSSARQAPPPLCDICQEKRGLLFCKEDRAILCRDCDVSVHTASELTMRHTRFLLTGVRLSAEPAACPAPPPPPPSSEDENSSGSGSFCCSAGGGDAAAAPPSAAPATSHGSGSDNGSSISEYLIKTLPGWHVEDFLVDEAAAAAATNIIGVSSADASYLQVCFLIFIYSAFSGCVSKLCIAANSNNLILTYLSIYNSHTEEQTDKSTTDATPSGYGLRRQEGRMGTPGQVPDTSWLPVGMDPKSTYLLKIRLTGNPKKRRKEFSCFHITKVVDSDLCNFKDLVETIVDAYPHGYNEIVSVFYYDEVQKNFPQVTTDQELLAMFNKHVDSKEVRMTITYSEPTDVVSIPESYTQQNAEVDYVTNNLAECFNNWIKQFKGLNLDDLMDKIGQLIMDKWDVRRTRSRKIEGLIRHTSSRI
ncbi:unnamed protein product [Miscanthus lutarioriparius]|uniref:B box-type domain-containing protein n=1 Tax=Miscanthus lutarioriparius TaxID=422564 RepID=A0A811PQM4_9POAL|nr:unnamed protein product [Miscanthus lutarioriparius]